VAAKILGENAVITADHDFSCDGSNAENDALEISLWNEQSFMEESNENL
jgi:hypothetical protein